MDIWNIPTDGKSPGYKNLAQALVKAIETGQLQANSPLPPSRVLAESAGVSRDTVIRCYKHLQNLGYVDTRGTSGTYVRQVGIGSAAGEGAEQATQNISIDESRLSSYSRRMSTDIAHDLAPAFPSLNFGSVPPQSLPLRRWRELLQIRSQPASLRSLQYEMEVLGRAELRQALSAYVNRAKGLSTNASDIAVFNISFSAFSLICRLILNPGDTIGIEDPGFGGIKNAATYHDLKILPLPIDDEGLVVDVLEHSEQPIKLVYVTSSHQDPTGRTMSLARRKQLLKWAKKTGAWIVDDDYDGFFHYGQKLPPALSALDTEDQVIYFGTFWQLLYPLTTVGFLVVPKLLMPLLIKAKIQTEGISETMPQLALADMLDTGFLQKHARKIERGFAVKRRTLIYELKRALGAQIIIDPQSGGITTLVRLSKWTDEQILHAAHSAGLPLHCLTASYLQAPPKGECLIYFPGLGSESEVKSVVQNFAKTLTIN